MVAWLTWLALGGCSNRDADPSPTPAGSPPAAVPFEPAPATLHRLTDPEWRNSVEDLVGVRFEGPLPVDYVLHGYARVGGSELTIGPLDLELYEAAAWTIAGQAVPNGPARDDRLGCDSEDPACLRGWVADLARRAWRGPVDADELDALSDLYDTVAADAGPDVGVRAVIAAVVASPRFLFRVEIGEPDPADPTIRRYTGYELAGRLASFLTASVPDEALLRAAEDGRLSTPEGLRAEAERLLETPRAREAMSAFAAETLELSKLATVTKDEALYPSFTEGLRTEMANELTRLFEELVFDRDADLAEWLTSDTSHVGPELAALYGVAGPASGTLQITLPAAQERGGLLGRAGILALQAHNTQTSPTHRGKFVQTRLLCRSIPPPPPGVSADLDALGTGGTLRDRLEQHATDPVCASCHEAMDPLGFALEHFDPIGARRELDNGLPIDATGSLDGAPFDGAVELGAVVAAHPDFPGCVALQLYRDASGQAERLPELVVIDELTDGFVSDGRRFRNLVLALVGSDAFLTASAPLGGTCTTEGETRACSTDCGAGTETCTDGRWRGCDAIAPGPETCNDQDDDCDGLVDERLEEGCDAEWGRGTRACVGGAWLACRGPGPGGEVCNGADDDGDSLIDEDLEIAVTALTTGELVAAHGECAPTSDPGSAACRAAVHRACGATGCAVTGFGPVALRATDGDVVCLDAPEANVQWTTYGELASFHGGCTSATRQGPDCNAAISRMCGARGLGTGYGPVESAGEDATVVCTPAATVYDGSYAALSGFDGGCHASARSGPACDRAIHAWCRDQGHETGHGPLENSGDLAIVACLGVL